MRETWREMSMTKERKIKKTGWIRMRKMGKMKKTVGINPKEIRQQERTGVPAPLFSL